MDAPDRPPVAPSPLGPAPGGSAGPPGWHGRVARYLFSTVAVGIGINMASNHGYPALTAATGLAAVTGVAGWLRHYPGSNLQRTARALLWGAAAGCSLASLVTTHNWSTGLAAAAASLLLITVLLATDLDTAGPLLGGSALIGGGAAVAVVGVAVLRVGGVLPGVASIGCSAAVAVAVLRGGGGLLGIAFIGLGAATAMFGVAVLRGGGGLIGIAFIGLGAATAMFEAAVLRGGDRRQASVASIGLGAATAVLGVAVLLDGGGLFGVAILGCVAALAVVGVATLRGGGVLFGVASIGGGAALAVLGVATLCGGGGLFGVAILGCGAAIAVPEVAALRGAGTRGWRAWWARLSADQRVAPPVPDPPGEDPGPDAERADS